MLAVGLTAFNKTSSRFDDIRFVYIGSPGDEDNPDLWIEDLDETECPGQIDGCAMTVPEEFTEEDLNGNTILSEDDFPRPNGVPVAPTAPGHQVPDVSSPLITDQEPKNNL